MDIKMMLSQDYDRVHDLWQNTPGLGLSDVDDSRESIGQFLRRNSSSCFVAMEEGGLAGTILSGHDGRRGHIYHLAVHPDCRRRGIGQALVQAALNALKAEGITKVSLMVFKTNAGGNAFWESLGFTTREDLVYRNKSIQG